MNGRTVFCALVVVALASVPLSAFAQSPIDEEAEAVTAGCHAALKRTDQLQTFEAGLCLGILKGLHYLSKDVCVPPATSLGQIGDVVARYFDHHADKARDDFREAALDAMRAAWPCGRKREI